MRRPIERGEVRKKVDVSYNLTSGAVGPSISGGNSGTFIPGLYDFNIYRVDVSGYAITAGVLQDGIIEFSIVSASYPSNVLFANLTSGGSASVGTNVDGIYGAFKCGNQFTAELSGDKTWFSPQSALNLNFTIYGYANFALGSLAFIHFGIYYEVNRR